MADPVSIIAGTVGLLDVCWKVVSYLKCVKEGAGKIEEDIDALQKEVRALIDVNESIKKFKERMEEADPSSSINHSPEVENLWQSVDSNTKDCKAEVLRLAEKVKGIMGKSETAKPTSKIDGIRKTLKWDSKDPDLVKIHHSLSKYQAILQALLTLLNIHYTRDSHKATGNAIGNLSNKTDMLYELQSKIDYELEVLRSRTSSVDEDNLYKLIATAAAVASKPINTHFRPPKPVSSIFTGREALLDQLRETLDDDSLPEGNNAQKRFVIQGLGGSGKTEFCCKFAQVNRQKFWGVFSINATSHESAKEGFAAISKIGGVEPNERAAKSWLSSLDLPWLLIIDNADDPTIDIEAFFPEGERGFILVTTRVPENVKHGTVGPKSYQFEMLESEAATDLLLRAARVKKPWNTTTVELANLITSALGCLPLALVHAGAAIANKLCELESYLIYFKTFWESIRQARKDSGQAETEDDKTYMSVYSSYEVIYQKLDEGIAEKSRDAVELLKIFAFFNRDNIRLDVMLAAAKNPGLEAAAEKKEGQEKKKKKSRIVDKPSSWTQLFRELLFDLRIEILKDRSQPILPRMLRDVLHGTLSVVKFEFRFRKALHVLMQWSLVTYHEENETFSMHPLVHVWVRERPQMTLGEQAIWSQAAMNTLGQTISLPQTDEATKDEMKLQRSLLLHVIHLRAHKEEIRKKMQENQRAHARPWPVVEPKSDLIITDRRQANQAAKFGYIYFICGSWEKAELLQQAVRDFLVSNLGLEHDASIRISRFLATTYSVRGRFNDAGDLSEQVLQAASASLGEEHLTTLQIKNDLGTTRIRQGRFPEAEDLFEQAIAGLTKTLGSNHQETLCAIDNLGQVHWNYFAFEKARDLHLEAIEGMEAHPHMGPTHEKTLIAKENLAMAYREMEGQNLQTAHHLMEEVVNERLKMLGREQPWTLGAHYNLAYVKHAMGDHVEAERIFRKGLPISERNLGADHPGVLSTQRRFAEILAAQKHYQEAENIYKRLLDRNRYVGGARKAGPVKGDHKDRIYTLYKYVLFLEQQGKFKEAVATCEELCQILEKSVHPIAKIAKDKLAGLHLLSGHTSHSV